jgi:hypothetical protein
MPTKKPDMTDKLAADILELLEAADDIYWLLVSSDIQEQATRLRLAIEAVRKDFALP